MQRPHDLDTPHVLQILRRWGIQTLGQFAALNKEEVGTRLGPAGLQLWDRAKGKTTRLLKLVSPPESFEETCEFENEIETVEPLLFLLRRFLQQLSVRLGALYLVARELRLEIIFNNKSAYRHRFKIPEPTNNVEVLFRMLHTHLENFRSEFPIIGLTLKAEAAKPSFQQFNLFETALRDPARLSETLARLTGLLPADHVGTPVLEETHRPDAFRMEPFVGQWKEISGPEGTESSPVCALRRLRSPGLASRLFGTKHPDSLRTVENQNDVVRRKGPYLASGNWWDEKNWECAEWDLELQNATLGRGHLCVDRWELDGIYD